MELNKKDQNIGAIISFLAIVLLSTYIALPILGFSNVTLLLSVIGIIFLSIAGICLFTVRKYRKEHKSFMIDYLNVGTQRYVLALLMIMYGIDKLLGNFFDYQLFVLDSKLTDVSEFQLAWFFYGKNRWQELFSGIMEFVPGLFLLRRRTYYVAAVILLPVVTQVFLLNFFFKIGGITFPVATILLACNLYIIYSQKEKIIQFARSLNFEIAGTLPAKTKTVVNTLKGIGILLALIVVYIKVAPVFFKSPRQKKYQTLVGVYTLKEMKKNNIVYSPTNDSLYYKDLYIEKQNRWNILRKFDKSTEGFILHLNANTDSMNLYLNKGGLGDDPDIIDSVTVLKGIYQLNGNSLTIKGVQLKDTLELTYEKQEKIKPKKWFW